MYSSTSAKSVKVWPTIGASVSINGIRIFTVKITGNPTKIKYHTNLQTCSHTEVKTITIVLDNTAFIPKVGVNPIQRAIIVSFVAYIPNI